MQAQFPVVLRIWTDLCGSVDFPSLKHTTNGCWRTRNVLLNVSECFRPRCGNSTYGVCVYTEGIYIYIAPVMNVSEQGWGT